VSGGGIVMLCDVDLSSADATRIHTIEVARAFAAEGIDVDLVARGPDPLLPGVRYERARGSDHQRVRRIFTINVFAARLLWNRRARVARLYVRHSWSIMLVVLVGRLLGYSVVAQIDGIPYGRDFEGDVPLAADYGKRLVLVAIGRLADGVVAITSRIRDLLVEQYRFPPAKIMVLPNGADVDFFTPLPRAEAIAAARLDPARLYVAFCGGFHPWVDFELMVGGFALARRQVQDARLLLIGDGPERVRIEEMAHELGITDDVIITGAIEDRPRIRDYLGAATAALVAYHSVVNRSGALPSKFAEYLASGRAVVAKEAPVLADALREAKAGIVVGGDTHEMSDAIVRLLLDVEYADELGAAGRRAAVERYSWAAIVRRKLELFSDRQSVTRREEGAGGPGFTRD